MNGAYRDRQTDKLFVLYYINKDNLLRLSVTLFATSRFYSVQEVVNDGGPHILRRVYIF